jgi:hypothetical protein
MADCLDNLILEQLPLIRSDIGGLKQDLADFKQDTKGDFLGQQTMMFGLASMIGQINDRVEHLEQTIGAKQ